MSRELLEKQQPQIYQWVNHLIRRKQLSHAYLFTGSFGAIEMALYVAQSQYCETPVDGLPCETCRACRLIARGEFSDVRQLMPTNHTIKTDVVRELLQDFAQSGFESDHHVLIIREADKLHVNAANSLLKFIEEPQSKVTIILLTEREEGVLATIKSRCQIIRFPKDEGLMVEALEKEGLLRTQAKLLSQLCPTVVDALAVSKQGSFQDLLKMAQQWVNQFLSKDKLVYLTTAQLVQLTQDKAEQSRCFDLLTVLFAKELPRYEAQQALSQLLEVRVMWQANVSFQNALEYMILE